MLSLSLSTPNKRMLLDCFPLRYKSAANVDVSFSARSIRMRRGFYKTRHNVGTRIPESQLRVGMQVHLNYTHFACVWTITSIEPRNTKGEIWINLRASNSGKTKRTNAVYATYIRADERR